MTRPSIVLFAPQEPSVASMISPLAQQPVKKIRSVHDDAIHKNTTVVVPTEFETVDS